MLALHSLTPKMLKLIYSCPAFANNDHNVNIVVVGGGHIGFLATENFAIGCQSYGT